MILAPLLVLFVAQPALAERPPPSFRDALVVERWHEVDDRITAACSDVQASGCDAARLREAIEHAEAFQATVTEDARLRYLQGLAWRLSGDLPAAERSLRRALALDADRADAWLELGAVLMTTERFDEAEASFLEVTARVDDSPAAWIGWVKAGEAAAWQGADDRFEAHLKEALRRGFTFEQIAGEPVWRGFYARPALGDRIEKLVRVYGDPAVLDTLR